MAILNRRRFLQLTGSAFAAVGMNALNVVRQGRRYAQVLAQPTSRKLALLVGINAYSQDAAGWSPLNGCVTDIQMQEELLVHRFGFNHRDIVTLIDQQATRTGILTAFNDHLIQQAKPGDVVVFHFSGHGSRIVDPNPCENPLNSSLVPIDSPLPENYRTEGGEVQDIMGRSLFLLMSALQTEHVTVVLDSCYSGGGKRGTMTIRSRDGADTNPQIYPNQTELSYQEQWRSALGLSPEAFATQRCAGIAKGVVIASAKEEEVAADVNFGEFHAGAFTYLMTQSLWQEAHNDSVERAFNTIAQAASTVAEKYTGRLQRPEFEIEVPSQIEQPPIYFISKSTPAAEAVVTDVNHQQVRFWLGGVHPEQLASYDRTVFRAIDAQGQLLGQVQTLERSGLVAQGEWIEGNLPSSNQPIFLQEDQRSIPENLSLQLGLDSSLDGDRSAVEQQLVDIPRVQVKPVLAGEIDYIIGRMTPEYWAFLVLPEAERPAVGSIGIFLPGQQILHDSFGQPEELIQAAIDRLRPKFSVLLAVRLLRLLLNPGSSQLDVTASLIPAGSSAGATAAPIEIRGQRGISAANTMPSQPVLVSEDPNRLPVETYVQIVVKNNTSQDLFTSILLVEPDGRIVSLFPTDYDALETAATVRSGETLQVPDPNRGDRFNLRLTPPTGKHEILVIASLLPIREALQAIGQLAANRGIQRGTPLQSDDAFLQLSETLINDLTQSSSNRSVQLVQDNGRYISSQELAAFSIPFEVYSPDA
ncbi:caspase family protein [Leptolyngbya sp. FACHB-671]|uniref:caspase family protein n=1 Tax=Leptolyngbya sp. FACHB-671 TaxID=2692812 RepID=UPI001688A09E|nr:caspase family protein [Leptolyngbya sp. FACHB-671]MBD2069515.1 caspase family protein [Leptolyngbya sp. FACHB-671]